MKEIYKNGIPQWYRNKNMKCSLVLSDDLDSLLSCYLLNKVMGWKIGYYYDFSTLYKRPCAETEKIYVDISITGKHMAFDNHVNRENIQTNINPLMINPNMITGVTRENYYDKYCGSTVLLIYSLYDIPLPDDERFKMMLLCIDSTYYGYHIQEGKYRENNKHYLCEILGLPELYEVESRHSIKEFNEMVMDLHLKEKIGMNESGKLGMSQEVMETLSKFIPVDEINNCFLDGGFEKMFEAYSEKGAAYRIFGYLDETIQDYFLLSVAYTSKIICRYTVAESKYKAYL